MHAEHRLKEQLERAGWRDATIVPPPLRWRDDSIEAVGRGAVGDWQIRVDADAGGTPQGYRLISAPDTRDEWPHDRVRHAGSVPTPEAAVGQLEEARRREIERSLGGAS